MRFVHITDSHVARDPGFTNYGHAPLASLEAMVDAINALAFPVDFVLHTGDVVEDGSEAAYRLAHGVLSRLMCPVYYVAGNHDNADVLHKVLLGRRPEGPRFDYTLTVDGVILACLDTRGPADPAGTLTDEQLAALRSLCIPGGLPLVIAMHHPPIALGSVWLDKGWVKRGERTPAMLLNRGREFLDAIAPARGRLRGVFFGHIHRALQVVLNGTLFCSAPSSFGQLLTWPDTDYPKASSEEPAGFSLVTVAAEKTVVSQHFIPRPA